MSAIRSPGTAGTPGDRARQRRRAHGRAGHAACQPRARSDWSRMPPVRACSARLSTWPRSPAAVYQDEGGWSPTARETLLHLAELDGLRIAVRAGEASFGSNLAAAETASAPRRGRRADDWHDRGRTGGRRPADTRGGPSAALARPAPPRRRRGVGGRGAAARLLPRRDTVATAASHPPRGTADRAGGPRDPGRACRRSRGPIRRSGPEPARRDARARGRDPQADGRRPRPRAAYAGERPPGADRGRAGRRPHRTRTIWRRCTRRRCG